jgi:hypothetical protein
MSSHRWVGCRVEGAKDSSVNVSDEDGRRAELGLDNVLAPSAVTELNLRQGFERAAKRRAFLDDLQKAGAPSAGKRWAPRPRDQVLVLVGGAYVSARVVKLKRDVVFAVVEGEGKEERSFPRGEVFPQPPVIYTPQAGMFACMRPPPGERAWPVVRIEGLSGGKASVSDMQGNKRSVDPRELVPFEK